MIESVIKRLELFNKTENFGGMITWIKAVFLPFNSRSFSKLSKSTTGLTAFTIVARAQFSGAAILLGKLSGSLVTCVPFRNTM